MRVRRRYASKKPIALNRRIAGWTRQLNDPYVAAAKEMGYRSRAAFKLQQLNEKFHLLKAGDCVVDLGAAPGGWSQNCRQNHRHDGRQ